MKPKPLEIKYFIYKLQKNVFHDDFIQINPLGYADNLADSNKFISEIYLKELSKLDSKTNKGKYREITMQVEDDGKLFLTTISHSDIKNIYYSASLLNTKKISVEHINFN